MPEELTVLEVPLISGSLPTAATKPEMIVVCSWCRREMGRKCCEAHQTGMVSHGICPECEDKF